MDTSLKTRLLPEEQETEIGGNFNAGGGCGKQKPGWRATSTPGGPLCAAPALALPFASRRWGTSKACQRLYREVEVRPGQNRIALGSSQNALKRPSGIVRIWSSPKCPKHVLFTF